MTLDSSFSLGCMVSGCEGTAARLGLCWAHYQRRRAEEAAALKDVPAKHRATAARLRKLEGAAWKDKKAARPGSRESASFSAELRQLEVARARLLGLEIDDGGGGACVHARTLAEILPLLQAATN